MKTESTPQDSRSAPAQTDRFIIWPAAIPIAAALLVATATSCDLTLGMLCFFLGALTVCLWALGMLAAVGLAALGRAWRRAVSMLAALLVVFVFGRPALAASGIAGDYVHFVLALPYYVTQISAADSRPVYFHWPSAGLAPSYERNLVYDSSDELASHVGKSEPWTSEPAVTRTVRHLADHFYLVEDFW
jgi:hypothetical protein